MSRETTTKLIVFAVSLEKRSLSGESMSIWSSPESRRASDRRISTATLRIRAKWAACTAQGQNWKQPAV